MSKYLDNNKLDSKSNLLSKSGNLGNLIVLLYFNNTSVSSKLNFTP
jgi:hypothetical protein